MNDLQAGAELDALIAELGFDLTPGVDFGQWPDHLWMRDEDGEIDIFGLEVDNHNGPKCERCGYGYCHHCQRGPDEPCLIAPPPYSDEPWAAARVMERLGIAAVPRAGGFIAGWFDGYLDDIGIIDGDLRGHATAETLPLAVCRSAANLLLKDRER